jgi:Matrixin
MRRIVNVVAVVSLASLLAPGASAYCLTGVRLPSTADVFYNSSGKITSGQCISASQMDSAVTGGTSWKALHYAGTTSKGANKRDGQNTVGWAKLGGGTLGVTNYLSYDRTRTFSCNGNLFSNLYEADVRITTTYRWTSGGGQCPCAAGSAYYLNAVALHEFGHVIGLCHTNQPSSLMYPSFGACENKNKSSDETAGESALCY